MIPKKKIICYFLLICLCISVIPIQSLDNTAEDLWEIEFGEMYKYMVVRSMESHGIDKYQNTLLTLDAMYEGYIHFLKFDKNGNEILNAPKNNADFSNDPIMDDDGNIFTYMVWPPNQYNCTYIKFDSNMSLIRKITLDTIYLNEIGLSNKGNFYLGRIEGFFSIDDINYTNTTIYAFNETGYYDWEVSFTTINTMNYTRSRPFLDWKFAENHKGDLFVAYKDDILKIDTNNRSVVWHRKLSQEIHSISLYEKGISVIYTNYTYGPTFASQISYDNELVNNFTLETKTMSSYYFDCHFNGEYYVMKTSTKHGTTVCVLKIFSADGNLVHMETYPYGSTILRLYSLSDPVTSFYVFEEYYNSTTEERTYKLKLKTFENILHMTSTPHTSILSFDLWCLLLIESAFLFQVIRRRKRKGSSLEVAQ